ncbi:MAG: hypothetical protein LAO56_02950 [Acidobacteriia bacterium]|nr:hypothetical protein [Terriglobia bacterium]
MRKIAVAFIVLALCSLGVAQIPGTHNLTKASETAALLTKKSAIDAATPSPLADPGCSFLFTSGAGNTFFSYCLTTNGNITQLRTPEGHFQISNPIEGYGICDATTGIEYFDYAFEDSLNWGPTTVASQTATSMKFVRTTSDGVWTLTQTITQMASTSSVKLTMALKNNSADSRPALLLRYTDVDVDDVLQNNFDSTLNSAMAWNSFGSGASPFGLVLQNVGTPPFPDYFGFVQTIPGIVHPCIPFANRSFGPALGIDGSLVMAYQGIFPKKATKTFNMSYKGL